MRAIDRLVKYAGNDRKIHKPLDHNGQDWSFYMTPLTIAEKQRATKNAKGDDATEFALQLLCQKAMDENGQKLFNAAADLPTLRNDVEAALLDKFMLALIDSGEEVEEEADMKSAGKAAPKGKRADS